MYKTPQNTYYLQLFLRQPGQEHPKPKNIQGCGTKCALDELYKVYEQLIPGDFEVECEQLNETEQSSQFDSSDQQNTLDTHSKINVKSSRNSVAINVNSCIFLIVIFNLWLFYKLFSKFYYKNRMSSRTRYNVIKV